MRKNTIRIMLVAVAVAASVLLVFGSSRTSSKQTPCEESMEQCCKKREGADHMIWETLSGPFFSSTGVN